MKLRTPIIGGAMVLAATLAPHDGQASSHREAPFIAKNPKVDGTDFYMFNSYETAGTGSLDRSGYVTILANYQGLQDGYGGPNYFNMDPDALYEVLIDNDGDGVEDITFQFDFDLHLALADGGFTLDVGPAGNTKPVAVPFHTLGNVVANGDEAKRNVLETYTVNVVRGPRRASAGTLVMDTGNKPFPKPLDNAGPKTINDYASYSKSFIRPFDVPGCTPSGVAAGSHGKVFVGQRKEGFSVNLGQIFDLVNMQPIQFPSTAPVARLIAQSAADIDQGFNTLTDKNVTTIALEVPASCLVKDGTHPKIGAWTTASVRQARVINPTGTFTTPAREGGPWVQVSRLGMPLVNEVVIGLKDKNKFNNSEPKNDGANFATYVTNPTLPEVVEILFGVGSGVFAPNRFPRMDLVIVFALGYPGVNDVGGATSAVAEMLRLNTAFGVTPPALQNPYGAVTCFDPPTTTLDAVLNPGRAGCDKAGFPNGRRPGDDVVDVSVRAAMGALINTTDAPNALAPLVDGAGVNATQFQSVFPYLNDPLPGAP